MRNIFYTILLALLTKCNAQKNTSMKTFDIEEFNKNKNQLNEYFFKKENKYIEQSELDKIYIEDIKDSKDLFIIKNQYYKNGNLKVTGHYFYSDFKKGIWKEYDEQGNLIKETDYDKGFDYGWEDLLKLLKKRNINLKDTRNTKIRKDDGRWHVWYVDGVYVYNIFIDGKTGDILLDDKDIFEEGS